MTWLTEDLLLREAASAGATTSFSARQLAHSATVPSRIDFFLSHSKIDERLVLAVRNRLIRHGYRVYVDWIDDPQLDRSAVSKATANTLRNRMDRSDGLLYLATQSSAKSTWMPWELGYFDGAKGSDRVGILPIFGNAGGAFDGNEYLNLYPNFQLPDSRSTTEFAAMTASGQVVRTVESLLGR
jgi:hypothetical protein